MLTKKHVILTSTDKSAKLGPKMPIFLINFVKPVRIIILVQFFKRKTSLSASKETFMATNLSTYKNSFSIKKSCFYWDMILYEVTFVFVTWFHKRFGISLLPFGNWRFRRYLEKSNIWEYKFDFIKTLTRCIV